MTMSMSCNPRDACASGNPDSASIEERLRESEARFSSVFHANPAAMVICCGPNNRIQYANDSTLRTFGYERDDLVGESVAALGIDTGVRPGLMDRLERGSVRDVEIQGRTRSGTIVDLLVSIVRVDVCGESCLLGIGIDVTERKRAVAQLQIAEQHLRRLTGKLLQAQDDERRRVARSLHETTVQDLAGIRMLLSRLRRTTDLAAADRELLDEALRLTDKGIADTRTLSYLLHPPFLDEAGLAVAIRWYVEGFTRRSGIAVELDLPESLPRLGRERETAAFYVVQEGLLNVHQHAGSPDAVVSLRVEATHLVVAVEDHGGGLAPDALAGLMSDSSLAGVGIAGTRERLTQVGGALEIDSRPGLTALTATIPIDPVETFRLR